MRFNIKDIIGLLTAIMFSFFTKWQVGEFYISAIYTVLGIMFSIAIGLIVSFNLQGVKKRSVVKKIRNSIRLARNNYIKYFAFATLFYLLDKYIRDRYNSIIEIIQIKEITIFVNFSVLSLLLLLFVILYYIVNFMEMQKLNDELYDEINFNNS